ncbi:uncharacterized protein G2W53_020213 [Senna tora]|uniref:Uncharacterized protein n=1 Tax=Senna tora TaxID=362788 RepID=A0A834U304_9FABA|nr:uncharacterized protein G2W53_020213 [Senna tora]
MVKQSGRGIFSSQYAETQLKEDGNKVGLKLAMRDQ